MKQIKEKLQTFLTSFSIQLKIYGMVVAVIILITGISMFVVRLSITDTLDMQLDQRAQSIGNNLAARSVDPLLTSNIYALQKLVDDTVAHNSDVEYAFITNETGEVIVYSSGYQMINPEIISANSAAENTSLFKYNSDKGVIRDSASPILPEFGGAARIGLRNDSLKEALNLISVQMIITMIGILVLSILVVLGLTRIITTPIKELVKLTKKVTKGDLTKRIHSYPNDEIGKLTQSFNTMLDNLELAEKENKLYNLKIVSRNRELSLLHDITGNFKSMEDFTDRLKHLLKRVVEELELNSSIIKLRVNEKWTSFYYTNKPCPIHQNGIHVCGNDKSCQCQPQDKKLYLQKFSLFEKEQYIGEISICSMEKLDYHTEKIIQSLAHQIQITYENINLWIEVKQKEEIRKMLIEKIMNVQEEERKRIARELHDQTSHSLSSILLSLKFLEEEKESKRREELIMHIRELTQTSIRDVHDLAWQLRPNILDKYGLKVALERYIEEFRNKKEYRVDLIINDMKNVRLDPLLETAVFRIIQESLTNASKYAQANNISVILIISEKTVHITIEDDGIGFDSDRVFHRNLSKDSLGLHGMLERVDLFNGTLNIESAPGEGTTILVKLPIRTGSESDQIDYSNSAS